MFSYYNSLIHFVSAHISNQLNMIEYRVKSPGFPHPLGNQFQMRVWLPCGDDIVMCQTGSQNTFAEMSTPVHYHRVPTFKCNSHLIRLCTFFNCCWRRHPRREMCRQLFCKRAQLLCQVLQIRQSAGYPVGCKTSVGCHRKLYLTARPKQILFGSSELTISEALSGIELKCGPRRPLSHFQRKLLGNISRH